MKQPGPCSRTREMATSTSMHIYWRVKASVGMCAFRLSGDPLG